MARARGTGTPTALKLLRGEQNSKINHDEPLPEGAIPDCPTKNAEVRAVWDYTVTQLARMRVLTMADRDALHTYCEQVVNYRAAAEMIHRDGVIINSHRGPIRHPAFAVLRDSGAMIKMMARDFGLTPSARTAIRVADQRPATQERPASRLLSS